MTTMTKVERVICALSREEPDQVPLYDLVDHRKIIPQFAGEELTLENREEVVPRAIRRILDTTRIWLPEPPGRYVDERGFVHERVDWWNEWKVQAPYHDQQGMVAFIQDEINRLEAWKPADPQSTRAELLEWQKRFGDTVLPASMAGEALQDAFILVGVDEFIYLELDQPQLVARWLDAQHQATLRRLQAELSLGPTSPIAWVFGDIAYKDHLMFSKAYLRSHGFFHRLNEIIDIYHTHGLKVIFHSDGNITAIVPELIATGADALAPVDTPAGMNLTQLKSEYGHQVAFVGGVDLGILSAGTPDEVRQLTQQVIKTAGPGGGLILGSSSEELFETLPAENILAMWETTWEHGKYPLKVGRLSA